MLRKFLDSESCLPVISKLFLPRCQHQEDHQCQFLHLAFLLPGGSEGEDFSAGRNEVVHTKDSVIQPEGAMGRKGRARLEGWVALEKEGEEKGGEMRGGKGRGERKGGMRGNEGAVSVTFCI